jgi:ribosomal protein S18 acetylase RimI-like enzyme
MYAPSHSLADSVFSVSDATEKDIPVISQLAHAIWPVAYAAVLSQEQIANMLERIYSPPCLADQMREGHRFFLARENAAPLGYASAYAQGDVLWLKKLYVLPNCQGQGVGTALMQAATGAFAAAAVMRLLVNSNNLPAKRWYIKQGFAKTGETPVRMGDFDFIDEIFSKPLPRI